MLSRLLPISALCLALPAAGQDARVFADPVRIDVPFTGNLAPIDGALQCADFDGDGDRDLLIGRGAYLLQLINNGTDVAPDYGAPERVLAGSRPLELAISCELGASPQLVDMNGDGRLDLLAASYPQDVLLFVGRDPRGYDAGAPLRLDDGKPLTRYDIAGVFAADWNTDGHLDVFVADAAGGLFVHEGSAAGYRAAKAVEAAGWRVSRGGRGIPWVVDWDGDELLDLVIHDVRGEVVWYRNEGSKPEPVFGNARPLLGQLQRTESKICCVDWNRDGKLDLVLARLERVQIPGYLTDAERSELEVAERRHAALSAEMAALNKVKPDLTGVGLRKRQAAREELWARMAAPRAKMNELQRKARTTWEYPYRVDLYLRR